MRFWLGITLLLACQWIWASGPSYEVELACDQVESNLAAIQQWTTSRGGACEMPTAPKSKSSLQNCKIDIAKCLPTEVLSLREKKQSIQGPNCWNLALVMAGILPAVRYSTPEEMGFFLNSPLCHRIGATEHKKPGDIGALRTNSSQVHAFMWISEDLVFSKNGPEAESLSQIQSAGKMAIGYRSLQTQKCRDDKNVDCELQLETLRCRSLEDYLKDPETMLPKKVLESFVRLEHVDKCLSNYSFNPALYSGSAKKNLIQNIQMLAAVFESEEFQKNLETMPAEKRKFVRETLTVRLNSMNQQMSMNGPVCANCRWVGKEIRDAAQVLGN
jgi:hypothetical protein